MARNSGGRRAQLPKGWRQIQLEVMVRDGYRCTEFDRLGFRCDQAAAHVVHTSDPSDHRLPNLRSLCKHHGQHKR